MVHGQHSNALFFGTKYKLVVFLSNGHLHGTKAVSEEDSIGYTARRILQIFSYIQS